MFPEHKAYTQDISQAYIQSELHLERSVFLTPPPEMELSDNKGLLARKSLYGIPKSGLHWFATYHKNYKENLQNDPDAGQHICSVQEIF